MVYSTDAAGPCALDDTIGSYLADLAERDFDAYNEELIACIDSLTYRDVVILYNTLEPDDFAHTVMSAALVGQRFDLLKVGESIGWQVDDEFIDVHREIARDFHDVHLESRITEWLDGRG